MFAGWFILGMIVVISAGTLASSVVIAVQKKGRMGERLSCRAVSITRFMGCISFADLPLHLRKGTKVRFCFWCCDVIKKWVDMVKRVTVLK